MILCYYFFFGAEKARGLGPTCTAACMVLDSAEPNAHLGAMWCDRRRVVPVRRSRSPSYPVFDRSTASESTDLKITSTGEEEVAGQWPGMHSACTLRPSRRYLGAIHQRVLMLLPGMERKSMRGKVSTDILGRLTVATARPGTNRHSPCWRRY